MRSRTIEWYESGCMHSITLPRCRGARGYQVGLLGEALTNPWHSALGVGHYEHARHCCHGHECWIHAHSMGRSACRSSRTEILVVVRIRSQLG